jgi:hypothetical protein
MIGLAVLAANPVAAQVTVKVTVTSADGVTNPTTDNLTIAIIDNARAAINDWCNYLSISGPRRIEVIVTITSAWQTLTATNAIASSAGTLSVEDASTPLPAESYYRVGLTYR